MTNDWQSILRRYMYFHKLAACSVSRIKPNKSQDLKISRSKKKDLNGKEAFNMLYCVKLVLSTIIYKGIKKSTVLKLLVELIK